MYNKMKELYEGKSDQEIIDSFESDNQKVLDSIITEERVKKIPLYKRYFFYFLFSLAIVIMFIFFTLRTIILLRFQFKKTIEILKVADKSFKHILRV